ncbi:hypothetical protein FACS189485_23120 [Spirochaetia bacterium]|nr:hypothetical protein FACS189485_23120 [Spirochaetia bacterium]
MADRERVLLLGNGINRVGTTGYSFDGLMKQLLETYDSAGKINKRDKPFPLLYEEILAGTNETSRSLLEYVAGEISKLTANGLHTLVWGHYDTILSTNYEYTLKVPALPFKTVKDPETRFSLYRCSTAKTAEGTKTLWQVHGEADKPNTLCLGYEHYIAYVGKIREYITEGDGKKKFAKLNTKLELLEKGETVPLIHSWVDHFFFSDMDILGLNLHTAETGFWWLLSYRSHKIRESKPALPKNNIRYFAFISDTQDDKAKNTQAETIELLRALGVSVETLRVKENDWGEAYRRALGA